jgi:hypothetical protein
MPIFCILSLGYDDVLMPLRSLLLHQAGYLVIETYSLGEVLKRLKVGGFDLLLICHTVPVDQREAIIASIHQSQPGLPFLCLAAEQVYSDPEHYSPAYNTAPEFLTDVSHALAKAPGRRA